MMKTDDKAITVLIIEDEILTAVDLKNKLERAGYKIKGTVSRGRQALEFMEQEEVDLVLMDIGLKGTMSGLEIASILRKMDKKFALIYITAYTDNGTIEKVLLTEPDGFVGKPFGHDLIQQINYNMFIYKKLQLSIFVIDDEISILKNISFMLVNNEKLKSFNPQVFTYERARQAIVDLGELRPRIIILDHMMPEMTGLEMLEMLDWKATESSFDVIILTAHPSQGRVTESVKRGVKYFLSKPFKMNEIIDAVEDTIKGRMPV